jgi:hypothetical protein
MSRYRIWVEYWVWVISDRFDFLGPVLVSRRQLTLKRRLRYVGGPPSLASVTGRQLTLRGRVESGGRDPPSHCLSSLPGSCARRAAYLIVTLRSTSNSNYSCKSPDKLCWCAGMKCSPFISLSIELLTSSIWPFSDFLRIFKDDTVKTSLKLNISKNINFTKEGPSAKVV